MNQSIRNKDWNRVLLTPMQTIHEALLLMESESLRIALVVDEHKVLIGTVTDGDIRRGLLGGFSFESKVIDVANRNPVTASPDLSKTELATLMQAKGILSIPIVDATGKLNNLVTLEELLKPVSIENSVFIMAGGFGTRLKPLTDTCPKPMLKVGEVPILERTLLSFVAAGFKNFYFSVHYLAEVIESHFGDGSKWGVSINYVYEDKPLGTGGALALLPKEAKQNPLIMINGDILTNMDFTKLLSFHLKNNPRATMCVREFEYQVPYGVVQIDGDKIVAMKEKPTQRHYVNAGIYVISPSTAKAVKENESLDLPSLLEEEIEKGEDVLVYPVHDYWLDIGQKEDFQRAQVDIKSLF